MRLNAITFLAAMVLTSACRTENCPTDMERAENGMCMDIEQVEEFDTGAFMDTGSEEEE